MSLANANVRFSTQSDFLQNSRSSTPPSLPYVNGRTDTEKKGLRHFLSACFSCMAFPRLSGKRIRKLRKRWRRASTSEALSSIQGVNDSAAIPVLSNDDLHREKIDARDKSSSLDTSNVVSGNDDEVIFSWDKVLSDAEDPNPPAEIPEHLKWYTDQPSHPCTLENGWIFCRDTSQYSYNLNGARHIRSCVINHALLGITFYQFQLESGEKFHKDIPVGKPHIANWLRGMLSMGNKLQWTTFGRHKPPSSPVEAFQILRDTYDLNKLSWSHIGLLERKGPLTSVGTMSKVTTSPRGCKLRDCLIRLDPAQSQSLLLCSEESAIVFLPTKDNRILLIDAHSHTHMNGGALILQCEKRAANIDTMLDDYFIYCVRPKLVGRQGDAYVISCPPRYTPCEVPV